MYSTVELPCEKCQAKVLLKVSAKPQLLNFLAVSIMVIEHPDQVACPNCGEGLILAVNGIGGVAFGTKVVPKREQNLVLTPGGNPL